MDATDRDERPRGYLPLERRRTAPIFALDPDALQRSARHSFGLAADEPPPAALLDAIVHALGFSGDFHGYLRRGFPTLADFLREHGLHTPADLFRPQALATREALAGRFFCAGRPLPRRVFLGTDGFDADIFAPICEERQHPARVRALGPVALREAVMSDVSALRYFAYLELRRTNCWMNDLNVLGDILLDPRTGEGPVPILYFNPSVSADERRTDRADAILALEWTRRALDTFEVGWLEVLPFNRDLIVLRGRDGRYDFVVRDLRDAPPPGPPFADHGDPRDLPDSVCVEHRHRRDDWFARGRWRAREAHEAETYFYARGHSSRDYSHDKVLTDYLRATGKLPAPGSIVRPLGTCPPGFCELRIAGRAVFVSDLVTVGEYSAFAARTGYFERRRGADPWLSVNDEPPVMPVAGHWFDALAYLAELERNLGAHARLPTIDEYLHLHPGPPAQAEPEGDANGVDLIESRPGWIAGARFRPGLVWRAGAGGLRFACGLRFGEWLGEHAGACAAAIGTWDLTAIYSPGDSVRRGYFPADNLGLYKCCKIGFRVCIDAA